MLRPGGLVLNGDHMREFDEAEPTLRRLGRALIEREEQRRFAGGHAETWTDWWDAAAADSELAGAGGRARGPAWSNPSTMAPRPGC